MSIQNQAITEENFNRLFHTWEDSVDNFFAYAEHCIGMNADSSEYDLLKYMVKTEQDLQKFFELYDGDIDHLDRTAAKMLAEEYANHSQNWTERQKVRTEVFLTWYPNEAINAL